MLRNALCLVLLATLLALGVGCEDKKKPLPPVKAEPAATTPAATSGSKVDRRVEAATKAMQEASRKREKQLDNVGK